MAVVSGDVERDSARSGQRGARFDAQVDEGVEPAPDWDAAAQPTPDFEVDQR
jgi:hypothetical protein